MKPTFMLIANTIPFVFVVPPKDLRIESSQNLDVVNIIDLGEKAIIGNRNLERISFSTFFPSVVSPFFNFLNPMLPTDCVNILKKWKDYKTKLALVVPEFNIYHKCYIEKIDIDYSERTGDIGVSISFVEIEKNKTLVDKVAGLFVR